MLAAIYAPQPSVTAQERRLGRAGGWGSVTLALITAAIVFFGLFPAPLVHLTEAAAGDAIPVALR